MPQPPAALMHTREQTDLVPAQQPYNTQACIAAPLLNSTLTATAVSCHLALYTAPNEPLPTGSRISRSLHCSSHMDVSDSSRPVLLPAPPVLPALPPLLAGPRDERGVAATPEEGGVREAT